MVDLCLNTDLLVGLLVALKQAGSRYRCALGVGWPLEY